MERVAAIETAGLTGPAVDIAACRHCGFAAPDGEDFCCYGCEVAARLAEEASVDSSRTKSALTMSVLLSMAVMMLALFLYAEDVYGVSEADGLAWLRSFYRYASAVLATPVMILCGLPLARHALSRVLKGAWSMTALIVIGSGAAYALSVGHLVTGASAVYFDSAVAALVLATLGRYLESTARSQAARLVAPESAALGAYDLVGGGTVMAARIEAGAVLRVPADRKVPVDLELLEGPVDVDTGILSGESMPRTLEVGAFVPSGAVPLDRALVGRALATSRDSTLERLGALASRLSCEPSPSSRLADRLATILTPLVVVLAGSALAYGAATRGWGDGVQAALAVVLVACPCTYAISTPLIQWLTLERLLGRGVLFRSADALERLANVEVVAFDKTGTLTAAQLAVTDVRSDADLVDVRALVAALERDTKHPVGRALLAWSLPVLPADLTDHRIVIGKGVEGVDAAGRTVRVRALGEDVVLEIDDAVVARFTVEERPREQAAEAVARLGALGVEATILTGDVAPRAQRVAEAVGLRYEASQSPEDKLAWVQRYGGRVAMVGDGVNDVPALAATVGITLPGGSELSSSLASVKLMSTDLSLVPVAIEAARDTMRTVRRMLIFATTYNVVFLAIAASGHLRPVFAGVSMLVSSLVTIGVASSKGGRT
ncbi:MAG: HAD-IC family P-type ATPase [Deltaproteobacteria bacterium]